MIGSSVLLYCHVDLGGIDITSATFAGLAGGIAFAAVALCFGFRFFPLLISVIISSIWSAIMKVVEWLHVKLAERWMDSSYDSRGNDPEINIEFLIPPGRD